MSASPEKKKSQERLRDGEGKFVPKNTPPENTATKSVEVSGPIDIINNVVSDPTLDKPILNVTVNNPFRKILQWIKEIKKKQTTTFEFKIKVPLIALPVFMIALGSAFTFFFNLGKAAEKQSVKTAVQPTIVQTNIITPTPYFISKVGVVKGTYQVLSAKTENVNPTVTVFTPSPSPTNTPTPTPPLSRYVLLDKDDKITFIIYPKSVKMESYLNSRVLITGLYDSSNSTIQIKKSGDIEVLP